MHVMQSSLHNNQKINHTKYVKVLPRVKHDVWISSDLKSSVFYRQYEWQMQYCRPNIHENI